MFIMTYNQPLTWLEISSSAIKNNYRLFQHMVGQSVQIIPVIKSNAYGHGMIEVARIISPLCQYLAVASGAEARTLRDAGIINSCIILSFIQPSEIEQLATIDSILPISTLAEANLIDRVGVELNRQIKVQIKIDTGTTRIGVLADRAVELAQAIIRLPGIKLIGAYSHLADAENGDIATTQKQLDAFQQTVQAITQLGGSLPLVHIACTAAVLRLPSSRLQAWRLGIGLYGLWPAEAIAKLGDESKIKLQPALSWLTRIIQIKTIPPGTSVGYGRSVTVKHESTIAVLPIGYWDGFDRKLSNAGTVLIRGQRCSVIGRVCMNLTMIDITDVPQATVGDPVTLIGQQANESITAEEMACLIGTINYEVVTRINPLLPRIVV
jgi:alanine racemase